MKNISYVFLLLCLSFNVLQTERVSMHRKSSKTTGCESSKNSALVEHFFNVIFTEFNTPTPICVCVQMCSDKASYCYPNGCMKRVDKKFDESENEVWEEPIGHDEHIKVIKESTGIRKNFLGDFVDAQDSGMVMKDIEESHADAVEESRLPLSKNPYHFKSKYQILKYKKIPKVEIKYNLREKAKQKKSDILKIETVDVSKTRWPKNRFNQINLPNAYKHMQKSKHINDLSQTGIVIKTDSDKIGASSTSNVNKYFKRDLSKKRKVNGETKTILLIEERIGNMENGTFSIETLIDNLIQNTIDSKKGLRYTLNDIGETSSFYKYNFTDSSEFNMNKINESAFKRPLNKMIENLSKKIDKQNNTIRKVMEIVVDRNIPNSVGTTEKSTTAATQVSNVTKRVLNTTVNPSYTQTSSSKIEVKKSIKKGKQRIRKRYHSKKLA